MQESHLLVFLLLRLFIYIFFAAISLYSDALASCKWLYSYFITLH